MQLSKELEEIRKYACIAHIDQWYGDKPYVFHLDAVYAVVMEFNLGIEYQIAAYLHDILEDTKVQREELVLKFGEHIATMVFCVSGFGANRKEKQQNIKEKMESYPASIDLKMADRLANMRNSKIEKPKLYELYCKEHLELEHIFSQGNPALFKKLEEIAGINKTIKRRYI